MRRTVAFTMDLAPFLVVRAVVIAVLGDSTARVAILLIGIDSGFVAFRLVACLTGGRLSPGKHLMGLRIVGYQDASQPSAIQSVRRESPLVVLLLASIYLTVSSVSNSGNQSTLGVSVVVVVMTANWAVSDLFIAFTNPGGSLHDKLAGTRVIATP